MKVLIVEDTAELGALWAGALARRGIEADVADGEASAIAYLHSHRPDAILVDLDLPGQGAIAVADYAGYRHPAARIVFVTASSFFSDGAVFAHSPNARALLPVRSAPDDIAAVVAFHGARPG